MTRVLPLLALCAAFMLGGCGTLAGTNATPSAQDDRARFDAVMVQERAWAGLETRQVEAGGLTFTYSVGGPEDGPTLVLLHGLAADRNHWNRVAKRLVREFRVYIPDFPGHGETPPLATLSFTHVGEALNAFIDTLPAQRVHVVGHSLGGVHAIRLGATRMSRVASLVLVNSAGVYVDNPSVLMQEIEQGGNPFHVEDFAGMERLFRQVSEMDPFVPDDLRPGWLAHHKAHQQWYTETLDAMRETSTQFTPEAFRANLRFLRAPMLYIWGEQDQLFPLQALQQLQQARPSAETVRLPGVGHMPLYEAPHMTALAIRDFVSRHHRP